MGWGVASKKLIYDNDSIELCNGMDSLKIDVTAPNRSVFPVNTALAGTVIVLGRLCLGCSNPDCDMCTFMSLAKLYDVLGECEQPVAAELCPNGGASCAESMLAVPVVELGDCHDTTPPTSLEIVVVENDTENLVEPTLHASSNGQEAQKAAITSEAQCVVVVVGEEKEIGPSTAEVAVNRDTTGIPEASTTPPSGANDGTCSASTSVSTNPYTTNKSFKGLIPLRRTVKQTFKQGRRKSKQSGGEAGTCPLKQKRL